ncbi:hypothetical protein EVAR_47887_1 [Eumeta japonica]|uniref:Uncharacterized protein n=1 Tax=Eumeta variegata TaxID=151549 RepID=A0A4C1Y6S4_EUMVA|nr:hypothetical protein EVAR_47887_1 [Eumeta japonica]
MAYKPDQVFSQRNGRRPVLCRHSSASFHRWLLLDVVYPSPLRPTSSATDELVKVLDHRWLSAIQDRSSWQPRRNAYSQKKLISKGRYHGMVNGQYSVVESRERAASDTSLNLAVVKPFQRNSDDSAKVISESDPSQLD